MPRFAELVGATRLRDPGPGAPMTREELGSHTAHMVWESLSDLLLSDEFPMLSQDLGIEVTEGLPEDSALEELLIFLLWAHTRAIRQAFHRRGNADALPCVLSALNRAMYEDLEAHGIARTHLPLLEQRVSARYFDYHHALEESPEALGRIAARQVSPENRETPRAAGILVRRAQEITQPLEDFLQELEVIPPGSGARGLPEARRAGPRPAAGAGS